MNQEPDVDLEIPPFLRRTPEQTQAIIEQNKRLEQEEQKRLAARRAAFERAQAQAKAERVKREARRQANREIRERRAAAREAKNAAYERLLRLEGAFTIGQAQAKLKSDRKLLLAALRRGLKNGHIRKASRRRYRSA